MEHPYAHVVFMDGRSDYYKVGRGLDVSKNDYVYVEGPEVHTGAALGVGRVTSFVRTALSVPKRHIVGIVDNKIVQRANGEERRLRDKLKSELRKLEDQMEDVQQKIVEMRDKRDRLSHCIKKDSLFRESLRKKAYKLEQRLQKLERKD